MASLTKKPWRQAFSSICVRSMHNLWGSHTGSNEGAFDDIWKTGLVAMRTARMLLMELNLDSC